MTTTFNAPGWTAKNPVAVHGEAKTIQSFHDIVTTTAALIINDNGNFGWLPPHAVVLGGFLKASAMDTDGSPTLTIDIGVTGSAQKFWAASTIAKAGGVDSTMAVAGRGYKNTTGAKQAITWLAHAAAATGAAGTLELHISYVIEEPATSG